MNEPNEERLDQVLRDWASQQRPAPDRLETLGKRILDAADSQAPQRPIRTAWSGRLAWFAAGVAAAVVAAAVVLQLWKPEQPGDSDHRPVAATDPIPAEARFDAAGLERRTRLFGEMRRVFADNLSWVAESNGDVLLGVEARARPSPDDRKPIVIRLLVMTRKPGETTWARQQTIDLILRDQEFVQLAPSAGWNRNLAVWAFRLPDGMIAVDTSLGISAAGVQATSYSGVQAPEVPRQILELQSDGAEYRVFQTVAVLPEEVG